MDYKKVRRIGKHIVTVEVRVTVTEYFPPFRVVIYDAIGKELLEEAHFDREETASRHLRDRLNFYEDIQTSVDGELLHYTELVELWTVDLSMVPKFVKRRQF